MGATFTVVLLATPNVEHRAAVASATEGVDAVRQSQVEFSPSSP